MKTLEAYYATGWMTQMVGHHLIGGKFIFTIFILDEYSSEQVYEPISLN